MVDGRLRSSLRSAASTWTSARTWSASTRAATTSHTLASMCAAGEAPLLRSPQLACLFYDLLRSKFAEGVRRRNLKQRHGGRAAAVRGRASSSPALVQEMPKEGARPARLRLPSCSSLSTAVPCSRQSEKGASVRWIRLGGSQS